MAKETRSTTANQLTIIENKLSWSALFSLLACLFLPTEGHLSVYSSVFTQTRLDKCRTIGVTTSTLVGSFSPMCFARILWKIKMAKKSNKGERLLIGPVPALILWCHGDSRGHSRKGSSNRVVIFFWNKFISACWSDNRTVPVSSHLQARFLKRKLLAHCLIYLPIVWQQDLSGLLPINRNVPSIRFSCVSSDFN